MIADTEPRESAKPAGKLTFDEVKRAAHGKGVEILTALGLPADVIKPGYHPCPMCGDKTLICRDELEGGYCCQKCQPTGIGDWFDFVGWIKDPISANGRLEFVATAIGFNGRVCNGRHKRTATPISNSAKPFEKYFKPINSPIPSLFEPLAKAKPAFTREGIIKAGGKRGKARFHPRSNELDVVGIPVYDPSTLEQIDWCFYGADGRPLPVGKGQTAKTRFLHGREGVFLSSLSLDRLKTGKAIPGLRIVKTEGLSDYTALHSALDEESENLLIFSQAAGACSLSTAVPMSNRLLTLQPSEIRCFGDRDLAGQAGLIGGDTKTGGIAPGFGYANVLAGSAAGPTFNVHLPYEITESKGKDVSDFLLDGHAATELFELPADKVAPCNLEEFQKRHPCGDDGKAKKQASRGKVSQNEIANFTVAEDESRQPRPTFEILEEIQHRFNGFPKRVGGSLFVPHGDNVHYLRKVSELTSWMRETYTLNWVQAANLLSKDELFDALRRHSEAYDEISNVPHFPSPIPGIYYTCKQPEPTDGKHLQMLLDRFSPATPGDRQLMLAAIVTLFWNGPPGQRVGFSVSSPDGQGAGKTTTVHKMTRLVGGVIDLGQKADVDQFKTRLLSAGAAGKRAGLIDNIKSPKYSSGDFEALITSPAFSGHRMYEGEATKKNYITFFLTMNSPSYSRDIAQRFVSIEIGRPAYTADWERSIDAFVDEHREKLISDIAGFFTRTPTKLSRLSRWGTWQGEVLARVDNAEEVAALIRQREQTNDADAEAVDDIEDYFRDRLKGLGFEASTPFAIHIPIGTVARWVSKAIGEQYTPKLAASLIDRYAGSGLLQCLSRNPSRKNGRGFVWRSPMSLTEILYKDDSFWDREIF